MGFSIPSRNYSPYSCPSWYAARQGTGASGKVYQYVHPCAFKFVHHIKNPAIKDDVLIFYATFAMLHRIVLYSFHHKVSENSKDSKTLSNLLFPRNLQNILTIKYVFSCGIKENEY